MKTYLQDFTWKALGAFLVFAFAFSATQASSATRIDEFVNTSHPAASEYIALPLLDTFIPESADRTAKIVGVAMLVYAASYLNAPAILYTLSQNLMSHISGQFSHGPQGKILLAGGMHTIAGAHAILRLIGMDPIVSMQTLPNGVGTVVIPPDYLNKHQRQLTAAAGQVGFKTIFPSSWTEDKIMDAIDYVLQSATRIRGVGRESFSNWFDHVEVRVEMYDGLVQSAFPTPHWGFTQDLGNIQFDF